MDTDIILNQPDMQCTKLSIIFPLHILEISLLMDRIVHSYNLRNSSTDMHIPIPKLEIANCSRHCRADLSFKRLYLQKQEFSVTKVMLMIMTI